VAFIKKRREADNWDREKAIDERIAVETDNVLTCQPWHDATSLGTTKATYTKLPTDAIALFQ
jgi:hypothetical protein